MSCSKDGVVMQMLKKGFVKPNLEVVNAEISPKLFDYLTNITDLAKDKYKVDMGPLFSTTRRNTETVLGDVKQSLFLVPNEPAFEAIDKSKQAELNKLNEQVRIAKYQAFKDVKIFQEEGNYNVVNGDIIVPNDLPQIKLRCR